MIDLTAKWREGVDRRTVNLADIPGWKPWTLSEEARREIEAIEANRRWALRNAHLFWFD